MSDRYVDQVSAFQYKGHTIEAHVARTLMRGAKKVSSASGIWVILVQGRAVCGVPASPDDREEEIKEKIKVWVTSIYLHPEHLWNK